MGWFGIGSSQPEGPKKLADGGFEAPDRTNRAKCYAGRDHFFACLDRHDILDSIKEDAVARQKCGPELAEFEKACVKTWVDHFKRRRVADFVRAEQLAKLEAQGATNLPSK